MEENIKIATAGNYGGRTRSDCRVTLELSNSGGIQINLTSKVKALYGQSIERLTANMMAFFEIDHAKITIEDSGALELVLMARIEATVRQLTDTDKQYLPKILPENNYHKDSDAFRFSRLYLPGNSPAMMINAGIHHPNGIILDLEDSVAPDKKDEARILVRNALRSINFYGAERMVRINQGSRGFDDLNYIVPHYVNVILVPKCETADTISQLDVTIHRIMRENELDYPIYYMPIIESAIGIENAYSIATASSNVIGLAIGLEDFTADLGVQRTQDGRESLYARTRIINACKAAGIQPIDSVFSDINDMQALRNTVLESKSLGFEGMGCIHPRQIQVIHDAFAPEKSEIEKAKKIVQAFEQATANGLGVVALGSKMIDPPVVKRAQRTINLALSLQILQQNWQETEQITE